MIDGAFIPAAESLLHMSPAWRNAFENTLTIQFDHRMLAYAIWLIALLHAFDAWRSHTQTRGAILVAAAVTLQALLGITTLITDDPLALALTHQVFAIVVFTIAIVHAQRLSQNARVAVAAATPAGQPA
jgi:cytochrome c oxidase assembly protein subunit 15